MVNKTILFSAFQTALGFYNVPLLTKAWFMCTHPTIKGFFFLHRFAKNLFLPTMQTKSSYSEK